MMKHKIKYLWEYNTEKLALSKLKKLKQEEEAIKTLNNYNYLTFYWILNRKEIGSWSCEKYKGLIFPLKGL